MMQYSYGHFFKVLSNCNPQDSDYSSITKTSRSKSKVKVIDFENLNSEQTMFIDRTHISGIQLEIPAYPESIDFSLQDTQDCTNFYQLKDSIYAKQDQNHEELKRARTLKRNDPSFGLALSNVYEFYDADDKGMYFREESTKRLPDQIFSLYTFLIKEADKTEETNEINQCGDKANLMEENKKLDEEKLKPLSSQDNFPIPNNQPKAFRKEKKKNQVDCQPMTKEFHQNKMRIINNAKKVFDVIRTNGKRAKEYCYSDSDAECEKEISIFIQKNIK